MGTSMSPHCSRRVLCCSERGSSCEWCPRDSSCPMEKFRALPSIEELLIKGFSRKALSKRQQSAMSMTMAKKYYNSSTTMAVSILLLGCLCASSEASTGSGGIQDIPGFEHKKEIQDLGRFAVDEYNRQQNASISFSKVVKAQEQVVSGLMYYLRVETMDGGKTRLYAAKIWVKPWEKFRQLQEFKPVQTLHQ